MRRIAPLAALSLICFAAACTDTGANYQPVVDGSVGPNYNSDLAACQNLAASQPAVDGNTAANVAAGAGAAAVGTAIVNNSGNNVRDAAAVGAVAGLFGSALQKNAERESIVKNCMRNRGYNVVG